MGLKKIILHSPLIPFIIFAAAVAVFVYVTMETSKPPEIIALEPAAGLPGDTLIIKGNNFGEQRKGGEVSVGGVRPTLSQYLLWKDNEIHIVIPDQVGSGKVFVRTEEGSSNGLLFTNSRSIPVVASGAVHPTKPRIETIEPEQGSVGTVITIKGNNFGREQGDGKVYFSFNPDQGGEQEKSIPAPGELDYNYVSWSNDIIKVTVPDGARSGNMFVQTDRGASNTIFFEAASPVGSKSFSNKTGYQLAYGIEVSRIEALPGSYVDFWLSGINESLEQRNVEALFEPEPMWIQPNGLIRYHIELPEFFNGNSTDLEQEESYEQHDQWEDGSQGEYRIYDTSWSKAITYWFERYTVETSINTNRVPRTYNQESRLFEEYTKVEPLIPKNEQEFIDIANALIRNERNPYNMAANIYNYVHRRLTYDPEVYDLSLSESVEQRKGDAFHYAFLFVTLCRSAGIPARPISGVFIDYDQTVIPHWWAEFYIENFGWVPVDPALGDDGVVQEVRDIDDPAEYFFGNLTNRHIHFSRGITQVPRMTADGTAVQNRRPLSLISLHEEASSGIREYRVQWKIPDIVDWW